MEFCADVVVGFEYEVCIRFESMRVLHQGGYQVGIVYIPAIGITALESSDQFLAESTCTRAELLI